MVFNLKIHRNRNKSLIKSARLKGKSHGCFQCKIIKRKKKNNMTIVFGSGVKSNENFRLRAFCMPVSPGPIKAATHASVGLCVSCRDATMGRSFYRSLSYNVGKWGVDGPSTLLSFLCVYIWLNRVALVGPSIAPCAPPFASRLRNPIANDNRVSTWVPPRKRGVQSAPRVFLFSLSLTNTIEHWRLSCLHIVMWKKEESFLQWKLSQF